jgi:hypothetical protein
MQRLGPSPVVFLYGAQEVLTGILEDEREQGTATATTAGDSETQLGGDGMPLRLAILDASQPPALAMSSEPAHMATMAADGLSVAATSVPNSAPAATERAHATTASSVVTVLPSPQPPAREQPTQQGGSSDGSDQAGQPKQDNGNEPGGSLQDAAGSQEQQQQSGEGQQGWSRRYPVWRKHHLPPPPPQRFPPMVCVPPSHTAPCLLAL